MLFAALPHQVTIVNPRLDLEASKPILHHELCRHKGINAGFVVEVKFGLNMNHKGPVQVKPPVVCHKMHN